MVHCHCAHSHDCIDHWFFDSKTGEDKWPAEFLLKYNRDQYPTHSLGPVLSWLDIPCGDTFDHITSMASDSPFIGQSGSPFTESDLGVNFYIEDFEDSVFTPGWMANSPT